MMLLPDIPIRIKAITAFIIISVVWGSTWAVGKEGVLQMPVLTLSYLRNAIAGFILVSYFLAKGHAVPKGKDLFRLLLLSLFLFVFNTGFSLWSLRFISAHTAAIIGCTSPLLIYALQTFLHRRNISTLFIVGCLISLFGVSMLVYDGVSFQQEHYLLGIALSFIAVLAWCIGFILMEGKKDTMDLYHSFGWQLLFSAAILYGVAWFTGNTFPVSNISAKGWMVIGYLSLFGSVIAFVCLAYIINHLPSNTVSLYVFINPVVAIIISISLLNEELTVAVTTGAALALLGVWISVKKKRNDSKQKTAFYK